MAYDPYRQQQPGNTPQSQPSQWQPPRYDPAAHSRRIAAPQRYQQPPRYPPPAPSRQMATPRSRRSYPAHLTRFPWQLMPVGGRGRRHSVSWLAWRVTHPVTAIVTIMIWAFGASLILGWMAAVTAGWLLWTAGVTAWWLAAMPFRGRDMHEAA